MFIYAGLSFCIDALVYLAPAPIAGDCAVIQANSVISLMSSEDFAADQCLLCLWSRLSILAKYTVDGKSCCTCGVGIQCLNCVKDFYL